MIHFPFDTDTQLDLMLSDRERAFQEGALRALAGRKARVQNEHAHRSWPAAVSWAVRARFRLGAGRPVAPAQPDAYPSPDDHPVTVIPIGRKLSTRSLAATAAEVPCSCGCMDGT